MRVSKLKSLFWTDAGPEAAPAPATSSATTKVSGGATESVAPDLAAIAANVEQRLATVEASIAGEQRRVAERRDARAKTLQEAGAKVSAELGALEERARKLREQLAALGAEAQRLDESELRQLTEFIGRTRAEAARLAALRDFMAREET